MDDLWLNMTAELLKSGLEDLFSINDSEICVCFEIRQELLRILVVDANSLGKDC